MSPKVLHRTRDTSREEAQPARSPSPPLETCVWCWGPMPEGLRAEATFCSKRCRQASSRFGLAVIRTVPAPVSGPSDVRMRRRSPRPQRHVAGRRGARSSTTRRGAIAPQGRCGSRTPTRRTPVRPALPGAGRGRPSGARRAAGRRLPGRVGAVHERRGAAAGSRALPGRGAGVLVAARGAPHPVAAADQRVGAADRSRRPRAAARQAAGRPRRARLRWAVPRVPRSARRNEATAVRGVDVLPSSACVLAPSWSICTRVGWATCRRRPRGRRRCCSRSLTARRQPREQEAFASAWWREYWRSAYGSPHGAVARLSLWAWDPWVIRLRPLCAGAAGSLQGRSFRFPPHCVRFALAAPRRSEGFSITPRSRNEETSR